MTPLAITFLSHALLVAWVVALPQKKITYEGYKVIRATPEHENHLQALKNLQESNLQMDFWLEPRFLNSTVDIMSDTKGIEELIALLQEQGIRHKILIDNVQREIDEAEDILEANERFPSRSISHTKYHRVSEINSWLSQLASDNPGLIHRFSIGSSSEGRELNVVKITKNNGIKKPAIWIDAGIHAREWIAPATALYVIDQLVNNYAVHRNLVDNIAWYILPVVNPDGYEYSHTSSRLWRKTRSYQSGGCRGTDGNRNWGFHWNEGGASSNPCSDTYRGPSAFSEPETKAISDFILSSGENFIAFLTIHSYGQMFLTPWGYTSALPSDYNDLYALAKKATDALTVQYGTRYTVGSSTNVLYVASGGSDDWAKGAAGIKYSYTLELRDTGLHGFVLPASQILPTAIETFEAIKVIGKHVLN